MKKYLEKPYTQEEIKKYVMTNGYIEGVVCLSLSEIIERDYEDFLDLISQRLIDSPLLMDIEYKAVEASNDDIFILVKGCVIF